VVSWKIRRLEDWLISSLPIPPFQIFIRVEQLVWGAQPGVGVTEEVGLGWGLAQPGEFLAPHGAGAAQ
jgi:hypothetical protein